jgi:hypothetical protein
MTPTEALQLISEALEPKAQGQISRAGYIAIQQAIETLAQAIKANAESSVEGSRNGCEATDGQAKSSAEPTLYPTGWHEKHQSTSSPSSL